jgi:hypothetical protein
MTALRRINKVTSFAPIDGFTLHSVSSFDGQAYRGLSRDPHMQKAHFELVIYRRRVSHNIPKGTAQKRGKQFVEIFMLSAVLHRHLRFHSTVVSAMNIITYSTIRFQQQFILTVLFVEDRSAEHLGELE